MAYRDTVTVALPVLYTFKLFKLNLLLVVALHGMVERRHTGATVTDSEKKIDASSCQWVHSTHCWQACQLSDSAGPASILVIWTYIVSSTQSQCLEMRAKVRALHDSELLEVRP